jgi:hypothetical protein
MLPFGDFQLHPRPRVVRVRFDLNLQRRRGRTVRGGLDDDCSGITGPAKERCPAAATLMIFGDAKTVLGAVVKALTGGGGH